MSDPLWFEAWEALGELHERKSSTYGSPDDPLRNFTEVGDLTGEPAERYALLRIVEKATRALNMIDAGDADAVKEYPDMASLALCCEALRLRRG